MDKVFSILEFEGDGYELLCSTMSEDVAYRKAKYYLDEGKDIIIELYKNGEYKATWRGEYTISLDKFIN